MELLDLQQREDNLHEARSANELARLTQEQADETQAQSRILMLFTVVTIVFVSGSLKVARKRHLTTDISSGEAPAIVFHVLFRYECHGNYRGEGKYHPEGFLESRWSDFICHYYWPPLRCPCAL